MEGLLPASSRMFTVHFTVSGSVQCTELHCGGINLADIVFDAISTPMYSNGLI